MTPKPVKPDFLSIALPLIKRGFRITPVNPETKAGCLNNLYSTTDEAEVLKFAQSYPDHNVGVVSKRGVGRLMFFDDDSGIVARIEEETGEKIPKTYRVQTRPDTNPKKQHFYFRQTEYSFKRFAVFADGGNPWKSKNVNRRDTTRFELSRSGLQIHPTAYDLKCIGGVNLVVAAGSLRAPDANGRIEKYTCVDEDEPVDIPNRLVDWFIKDIRAYHKETDKEKEAKFTERIARPKDSKVIADEDIYDFLRWRAHDLVGQGLVAEGLENALTYLARMDGESGEAFVSSEHGKKMIHNIAFSDWKRGVATWFYRARELKSEVQEGGHIMIYKETTKQEVLDGIIKSFPDKIYAVEALEKIAAGLAEEDYTFDNITDRGMVYLARKRTGFTLEGHRYWVRTKTGGAA